MSAAAVEATFLNQVYDAALDARLWPAVLEGLSDLLNAGPVNLTRLRISDGGGQGFATRSDPSAMTAYFERFASMNPFTTGDPDGDSGRWSPRVYTDEQAFSREAYVRSEFFNDHVRRVGGDWSMVIRLGREDGHVSTIHLGRPDRQGRFEPHELERARRLQPHLIRAFALTSRLAEAESLRMALDHAEQPMLLTDGSGRLLYANATAEDLLRAGVSLRVVGGRVSASHAVAAARLASLIATAARPVADEPKGGSLSLPHTGGPLVVNVLPARPASGLFAPEPAVVISVAHPSATSPPSTDQLAARYGLTPAESRVVLGLLEGLTARDMATRFDLRLNTVRVQLAAVFDKTGVHRQAELVRLLLTQQR